ncbi:ADP-ribosylglycohydrolase family protein [Tenacibaculum amylolyticum]|uniref:ADP-ribosylglycohydrolase family protein n=1 Tax=Tenacibaculum amylolyticum TaxID=104269 RepID=UPI0038935575
MKEKIEAMFLGLAIGDALGVPVEFTSRFELEQNPVTNMLEFGSHNQPKGTWSDDSSLTFCLAESLLNVYKPKDIAIKFAKWYSENYWTAGGEVFDVGIATSKAISSFIKGTSATLAGGRGEFDNGNGSLMRISPLAFYVKDFSIEKRFDIIKEVSSITHGHIRAVISCFIYIEFLLELMKGIEKLKAYKSTQQNINEFLDNNPICSEKEIHIFERLLKISINSLKKEEISSSGYVVHTLEASLWSFLTSNNYKEATLKAVNLGEDTDTTACVTGALAGLYYGLETVPKEWINQLARVEDIKVLAEKFAKKYGK